MWRLLVTVAMMVGGMAMADTYKGNETPAYTVEQTDGAVEVRLYAPHIAAEVTVPGSRDQAVGAGFRLLAGYIFGGNDARAKVAMTTPVTQAAAGNAWRVQFMMPTAYTPATLPKPKDGRIRFVTTPPRRMLALRFSGIPTTAVLNARAADLRAWAAARQMTLQDPPQFFYYDGPLTLPWNRRNEVAFGLD